MEVPKMFRAQVQGHCNLQFVPDRENREKWVKEWVDPQQTGKPYQHENLANVKKAGLYGSVYCIPVKFPYRLFTNCGQDTIHRPALGKNGIPFVPGSSIKGLFRRVCMRNKTALLWWHRETGNFKISWCLSCWGLDGKTRCPSCGTGSDSERDSLFYFRSSTSATNSTGAKSGWHNCDRIN
jgi:hypothetical protein